MTEIILIVLGIHTANVVNLADESQSNSPLQPDVLRIERNFSRAVALDMTKIDKISPEKETVK